MNNHFQSSETTCILRGLVEPAIGLGGSRSYAPIQATVEGEPLEIYPFLGCSRLEEPLMRYPVSAVFHGHAHHGQPEGRTRNDVPVFNVSASLMREVFPDRPFRLVDVNLTAPDDSERRAGGDRRAAERETTTTI